MHLFIHTGQKPLLDIFNHHYLPGVPVCEEVQVYEKPGGLMACGPEEVMGLELPELCLADSVVEESLAESVAEESLA